MAKARLRFALYENEQLERRETLEHDIIKIGHDPRSHLHVKDACASRMHAVIEVASAEELTLIALGGRTLVNGGEKRKCRMRAGDQIQIGTTRIVLEAAAPLSGDRIPVHRSPERVREPAVLRGGGNPFAAGLTGPGGEGVAAGGYTYALLKSGPDVPSEEVESSLAESIEVMVLWGSNVIHVSHLTPPRAFYVGEPESEHLSCDFLIPEEQLGTSRMPVVTVQGNAVSLVIPPNATGRIELPGQAPVAVEQARRTAGPCPELSGGHVVPLPRGAKARIELGPFAWVVATVAAGRKVARGMGASADWSVPGFFGLSSLALGAFIAAMAFFVPPEGLAEDEAISIDRLYMIQQYLRSAAEREQLARAPEDVANEDADDREGGTGTRAKNEEGSMGKPTAPAASKRWAVRGDKDNPDPHIAFAEALREARNFGLIGLLPSLAGGPHAPTAPWGREDAQGKDELSAQGNMWGDEIGDAFGAGGLGLTGIGEGGGGVGEGIGLDNIGTLGHGAGTGTNQGFGAGHGRLARGHATKVPTVSLGQTTVSGRLPPEVIQRIVRQNYGRFRMCYEQGLAKNPNLEGRVTVRFIIGRDGSVSNVSRGDSDLPDANVVGCIMNAYYGLSFPQPEGGIVTVVYPIMFASG